MNNEKNIFVLITRTESSVSKYIRRKTNCEYTHSSISLNQDLTKMYSFARRRPHNFLISGFIKEDLNVGVYSWNPDAPCLIYRYRVSEESYEKVEHIIESFIANYKKHKYNMLGLVAIGHGKELKRKYKYACSQFVAKVLNESDIIKKLDKSIWMTSPDDVNSLCKKHAELVYDGNIKNVQKTMTDMVFE